MTANLAVVVNDELILEYDRAKALPAHQQQHLQKLDGKFDQGIELQGHFIAAPDIEQRAKYMALSLMEGIIYQEDARAAVSLAWLATRLPELQQVKAIVDEQGTHFDLIFDRAYQPHQVVHFDGLDN
ncbi:MAG: hypothetical protein QNJ69_12130 [Gammaproteobacteria bacterium]|nr:hypothetical protein [Gammaproteobacteria bacterium]